MVSTALHLSQPPRRRDDVERLRRPPRPPRRWRAGVAGHRALVAAAFVCIVLVDAWADLNLPAVVSTWIVGPTSVVLWALMLLGSMGIGPVAGMRKDAR